MSPPIPPALLAEIMANCDTGHGRVVVTERTRQSDYTGKWIGYTVWGRFKPDLLDFAVVLRAMART